MCGPFSSQAQAEEALRVGGDGAGVGTGRAGDIREPSNATVNGGRKVRRVALEK
jgi:hypothetical protein